MKSSPIKPADGPTHDTLGGKVRPTARVPDRKDVGRVGEYPSMTGPTVGNGLSPRYVHEGGRRDHGDPHMPLPPGVDK